MSRIRRDTDTPADGERPVVLRRPDWEPEPYTPPTDEERAKVLALIAETAAHLGAEPQAERRPRIFQGPVRCGACETGNFVHQGVRYCLEGYLGRHVKERA